MTRRLPAEAAQRSRSVQRTGAGDGVRAGERKAYWKVCHERST